MFASIARLVTLAAAFAAYVLGQAYGLPSHVYLYPFSPSAGGQLRFLTTNQNNYVALFAPSSLSGNVNFRLPSSNGSAGQFLQTDGQGNTSWESLPASVGQVTWSFVDVQQELSQDLDVPYIYMNRARAFTVTEIWCRIDAGLASIQVQKNAQDMLSSPLACTTSGAFSTSIQNASVGVGDRLGHVTVSASGVKQLNVVVKYSVN